MKITKIIVDMVLVSGDEFLVRYEYENPRYRRANGEIRGGDRHTVSTPVYARIVSSQSVQLYDITDGSIRKVGNRVSPIALMDFSHAVRQDELSANV